MFSLEMTEPQIDLFNEFWKVCPRKCGKKKAKTAFNNLSAENKAKAMADYSSRYEGVEKIYIPFPATYINQERWEDEPPEKQIKMPRTNEEWDKLGRELNILPRRGETYPNYKDRLLGEMRSKLDD